MVDIRELGADNYRALTDLVIIIYRIVLNRMQEVQDYQEDMNNERNLENVNQAGIRNLNEEFRAEGEVIHSNMDQENFKNKSTQDMKNFILKLLHKM